MADEIPQWAKERAMKLCLDLDPDNCARTVEAWEQNGATSFPAFARYIMEHEEPPEDPLLIEARDFAHGRGWQTVDHNGGDAPMVRFALAALKRGIELGKAGEA